MTTSCILLAGLAVAAPAPTEFQIKAVYLFNFAQFVEWPAAAFVTDRAPLAICILGADPFGEDLDSVVQGEAVNGRPLVVRRLLRIEEGHDCQILYVSASHAAHVPAIIQAIRGKPILSVSDIEGFARRGGVIRFVTQNRRIRFRINVAAANAANLVISSKLLRISEIVPAEGGA